MSGVVNCVAYAQGRRLGDMAVEAISDVLRRAAHRPDQRRHRRLALGETHIFAGTTFGRESTERVYRLKRDLLELKRCVSPLIDMCNRLMRSDFELIPDDTRVYFRDVYDHVPGGRRRDAGGVPVPLRAVQAGGL